MRVRNILLLVIGIAVLWGCQMAGGMGYGGTGTGGTGSGGSVMTGPGYTGGTTAGIYMSGFAFRPSSVSFLGSSGVTVTWTNYDSGVYHTVTWDTGAFSNSGNIGTNGTFSVVVPTTTTPGTYTYHCSIHAYMTGSIVVK